MKIAQYQNLSEEPFEEYIILTLYKQFKEIRKGWTSPVRAHGGAEPEAGQASYTNVGKTMPGKELAPRPGLKYIHVGDSAQEVWSLGVMGSGEMASPKSMLKDVQMMAEILKDMGVTEWEEDLKIRCWSMPYNLGVPGGLVS